LPVAFALRQWTYEGYGQASGIGRPDQSKVIALEGWLSKWAVKAGIHQVLRDHG